MDVLLAFPALLLAIAIVTVLGPGLDQCPAGDRHRGHPAYSARGRASVLSIKEQEFVTAARMIGVTAEAASCSEHLAATLTPLIVQGTLGIATAILDAAALSFLGLGAQPPTGRMGFDAGAERNQVFTAPHLVLLPRV